MNEQDKLIKKESNRYRVLKLFYDTVGEQRHSIIGRQDVIQHLVKQEEISEEDVESALNYLEDENLLKSMTLDGGTSITHLGVKEIEDSIKYPEKRTRHFSAQTIQVFYHEVVMGDKFEKISNSTIVNRSEVDNAFNSNIFEQKKALAEAVSEIQGLLEQLEKANPTATDQEKVTYVNIATKPDLKQRAIAALKEGSNTAIDEFILDNKYLKVVKAVIQGWLQPK